MTAYPTGKDLRRWVRLIREARKVAAPGGEGVLGDLGAAAEGVRKARVPAGEATADSVFIRMARASRALVALGGGPSAEARAAQLLALADECAAVMPARFGLTPQALAQRMPKPKPPAEPGSPAPYYLRED
jgi:hypothetical protein